MQDLIIVELYEYMRNCIVKAMEKSNSSFENAINVNQAVKLTSCFPDFIRYCDDTEIVPNLLPGLRQLHGIINRTIISLRRTQITIAKNSKKFPGPLPHELILIIQFCVSLKQNFQDLNQTSRSY